MEIRSTPPVPTATADMVTLTLVGTFNPAATLQDRLNKLPMRFTRTEANPVDDDLMPAFRVWSDRIGRLNRVAESYALHGAHAEMVEALSSMGSVLSTRSAMLEEKGWERAASHVMRMADDLKDLRVTCGMHSPTLSDGAALMTALRGTLNLAVPAGQGSGHPDDVRHSPLWRFGYGSPWFVEAGVVLGSSASLAALIFGIKALCGIDLEVRLHRAELRARLEEAEERVRRLREVDKEQGREWADRGATRSEIAQRKSLQAQIDRVSFFPWQADQAVLSDQEQ